MDNIKEEIREIIKPHFGYLKKYTVWGKDVGVSKIRILHNFVKRNKDLIKSLPKPINNYDTYENLMKDIDYVKKEKKVNRIFKDNLNGNSRKIFRSTYSAYKDLYHKIVEKKFNLELFIRNSSKPKTKFEFLDYLEECINYDNDSIRLRERIENEFDFIKLDDGRYIFKLDKEALDIVPVSWCIYNDPGTFEGYEDMYHSIWVLFNPDGDNVGRMYGINVDKTLKQLYFQNSMNHPESNVISVEDFMDYTMMEGVNVININSFMSDENFKKQIETESEEMERLREEQENDPYYQYLKSQFKK